MSSGCEWCKRNSRLAVHYTFVSFPWILLCGYTPKWYASGKEEISSNMVVCSVVAVKRGWRCKWKVKGEKVVCDGCDMIIFLLFMRLFINNTRRKGSELTHVSYTPSLVFITGLSTRKKTQKKQHFFVTWNTDEEEFRRMKIDISLHKLNNNYSWNKELWPFSMWNRTWGTWCWKLKSLRCWPNFESN